MQNNLNSSLKRGFIKETLSEVPGVVRLLSLTGGIFVLVVPLPAKPENHVHAATNKTKRKIIL